MRKLNDTMKTTKEAFLKHREITKRSEDRAIASSNAGMLRSDFNNEDSMFEFLDKEIKMF